MKRLKALSLAASLFLAAPAYAFDASKWNESSIIGTVKDSPTQENVVFVNSYTGTGQPAGVWTTYKVWGNTNPDLDKVPCGTKAFFTNGILIITHGVNAETADLTISVRRKGSLVAWSYVGQTIEASTANGQRSGLGFWVPLNDQGEFELLWTRTNYVNWPDYSAYGINLNISAYVR